MHQDDAASDTGTFIDLLIRHRGMIFRYVMMFVPQSDDAEELYQQTCLTMWTKWSEGLVPDYFAAWARTIAYNHVRNFLRQQKRLPGLFTEELLESIHARSQRLDQSRTDRLDAMKRCISELPPHHQQVVREYYGTGATVEHLANHLGRPVQGLYKALQRVRKTLLECIDRRLREDEA